MNRIRTPDEIKKLPGYVAKVDPNKNPLNRIVAHYYIRPFDIKCGLCGIPHMDGCIVELANRRITNIGHICGKRFGESFDRERRNNYENDYKPRLLQTITQAQTRLIADHFKLNDVSLQASEVANRMIDFTAMFPTLVATLRRRAYSNTSDVSESVKRTKEEIDDLIAANRFQSRDSLVFKEYRVGTIRGFRLPMHDWSLSTGLRKLFNDLIKFTDLKPRSLPMKDLQRWAHWAEDFDTNLARTVSGIEDAMNFFTIDNFQLFAALEPLDEKKKQLCNLQVRDIHPLRTATVQQSPRPQTVRKTKPKSHISAREMRRITGDKKAR